MTKELERQIWDLQKEVAEVPKEQAAVRLRSCLGDSEIRKKEGKLEELDRRATDLDRSLQDLKRKRQILMAESVLKGTYRDIYNSSFAGF